ncbi:hypothetical protein PSH28_20980 [Pseudomonas resinovorans]|uniref:hypothetical protein n=1 Tax=Metapseudomonas resinovorans TaxID=53412 RepID=UPI00237F062F|nr:hypothetical protein [Pseudomonas resinovorans]MDE3739083.1 hypothetical protein [Pseudomonas resinovorans]
MRLPELMISWLLTVLGKKLLSVSALFHVFASERDSFPQEVGLLFEGSEVGKLYGGRDGASLSFSLSPIVGCDLGEYGKQDIFCVSGEPCYSSVVGRKLASASLVQSSVEEAVVGVVLSFDSGPCLSILNLGDELFVYNKIPEKIVISEGLSLISVS